MSLKFAIEFGKSLNSFETQKEAEKYFSRYSARHLSKIYDLAKQYNICLNNTPESLKDLELWYFNLYDQKFKKFPIKIDKFEKCMAMYFLKVAVENDCNVHYKIREYAFSKGRYEFGVESGLMTFNLSRCTDHYKTPNNKKRQSLFRTYNQYFKK